MTSSIFDILKQRLTPLYPQMAGQSAMPDTHGQMVAQGQQQNDGLGSLLRTGASLAAGAFGEKPETFDASRYSEAADQTPAPSGRELGIGSGRDMSATGPGLGETPTPPPASQYADFLANAGPATSSAVGSGRGLETAPTPTPTPTPQVAEQPALQRILSRREKLEQDIADIQGKQYHSAVYRGPNGETSSKPKEGYVLEKAAGKNRDKSHNFIDVLKGIGLGALQGAAKGGLPGLIGGAAAGGVASGVDASADNKMWDDIKIAGLRSELEAERNNEIGAYRRDKAASDAEEARNKPIREAQKASIELAEKQAKLKLDAIKESLNLTYYDPKRPDHRAIAQQAGIDPDTMPAFDDRNEVDRQLEDGTTVRVKGSDALEAETRRKEFDATKVQDIVKFNADNKLKVQEKNVANAMKFNDDVRMAMTYIAQANAQLIAAAPEAQSFASQMQTQAAAMAKAAEDDDADAFEAARKSYDDAAKGFATAIGKAEGGRQMAADFKKMMPKRPDRITYEEVSPTTVGGGPGVHSEAAFTAAAKARGLKGAQLKAAIEKAKADGVIR